MKSPAVLSAEKAAAKLADKYVARDAATRAPRSEKPALPRELPPIDDDLLRVARFIAGCPAKVCRNGVSRAGAFLSLAQFSGMASSRLFEAVGGFKLK